MNDFDNHLDIPVYWNWNQVPQFFVNIPYNDETSICTYMYSYNYVYNEILVTAIFIYKSIIE